MSIPDKKKLKLFNKKLNDFCVEYNNIYKKNVQLKVSTVDDMINLHNALEFECYKKQDVNMFKNTIFNEITHFDVEVWQHLYSFYLILFKILEKELPSDTPMTLEFTDINITQDHQSLNNLNSLFDEEKFTENTVKAAKMLSENPHIITDMVKSMTDTDGQFNIANIFNKMNDPKLMETIQKAFNLS